jgi:hypothetical protein
MVDDLKLEIPIEMPLVYREKMPCPFEVNGIIFSPEFNRHGDVLCYSGQLENLYLKMVSGRLLVMNSWHKFYHGDNWSDFTWDDLQNCMHRLADLFGDGFWRARITKLTASVNLSCEAGQYIERLISYKGNPMEPMRPRSSRIEYGKRHASTHYNIKVYDKSHEVKLTERLVIPSRLRIEKEMKMPYFHNRKKNPIRIYSPSDLTLPSSFDVLGFELFETISSLGFDYGINPMDVQDFQDSISVVFMGNPEYRKVLKKKSNYRTFKSHERRYEELRNEFQVENASGILNELLEQKMLELRPLELFQKPCS